VNSAAAAVGPGAVPCPLCRSQASSPVGERQDGVAFRQCDSCGLAFAEDAPSTERAAEFYQGDYFGSGDGAGSCRGYQDYLEAQRLAEDPSRLEMCLLRRHGGRLAGKRALEIGCASGTLLALLAAEGCRVAGVELNPAMARRAQERLNAPVYERPVETGLPVEEESIDLLLACSVLEHSADPRRFLDELERTAAPGALLLLVTPDWDAAQTEGEGWTGWHGQWDHLCYFSLTTLDRALAGRGFHAVEQGYGGPPAGLEQLRRASGSKDARKALKRVPVLGPSLVRLKRRLFPVRLGGPGSGRADLIALYRKQPVS